MENVKIVGSGSYVPGRIVTNRDLERLTGVPEEEIQKLTGIKQRCFADNSDTLTSMGLRASIEACRDIPRGEIDAVIYLQNVPSPDTVYMVAGELHDEVRKERIVKDKSTFLGLYGGCAEWLDALKVGYSLLQSGLHKRVLCVSSTDISRYLDFSDKSTSILFADGASANVLQTSSEEGFLKFYSRGDGSGCRDIVMKHSEGGNYTVSMQGNKVFHFAVRAIEEAVRELTKDIGIEDIDYFIFHQANGRILDAARRRLRLPEEKEVRTIETLGNTSSTSIGIALDRLMRGSLDAYKKPEKGDLVLMAGFGAGLKITGALYRV